MQTELIKEWCNVEGDYLTKLIESVLQKNETHNEIERISYEILIRVIDIHY